MKLKRIALTIVLTLAIVMSLFSLVACSNTQIVKLEGVGLPKMQDNQFVIIINDGEQQYQYYVLNCDVADNVFDALKYLNEKQGLTLEYQDSQYGAFLTAVGSLKAEGNSFVSLYTSIEKEFDTSAYATTYDCGGVKIVTSGFGASSMSIESKCVIYIELGTY